MKEQTFDHFRGLFADFYGAVKEWHGNAPHPNGAHSLEHDVTVSMLVVRIGPDDRTIEKAWCASLIHSVDRQFGRYSNQEEKEVIQQATIQKMGHLLAYLPADYFSQEEVEEIFQAALRHSEMNQDDQSLVQRVLMDADRLANLMMSLPMRAAAHQYKQPVLELQYLDRVNPASTYADPLSAIDDVRWCIHDYLPQMRLPLAVALAQVCAQRLEGYLALVKADYDDLGITGIVL